MGLRQLFEHHPVYGYRFIPGLYARVVHEGGGYVIQTNREGFRCDREVTLESVPGVRRVLLFGDSFTAGDGVDNHERFGDRLEHSLPNLEVLNFGLPASGTDQQYLIWEHFASRVPHDLVVLVVYLENIRRLGPEYEPHLDDGGVIGVYAKPRFEVVDGAPVPVGLPVPRRSIRAASLNRQQSETLRWLKGRAQVRGARAPFPEYADPAHPGWRVMRAILECWAQASTTPMLVVTVPPIADVQDGPVDGWAHRARFSRLARDTGVTWYDLLPDLASRDEAHRRTLRFERDVHFTPAGHAELDEALAPVVAGMLPSL